MQDEPAGTRFPEEKVDSLILRTGCSVHGFVKGPIYIKLFLKETFDLMSTVCSVRLSVTQCGSDLWAQGCALWLNGLI